MSTLISRYAQRLAASLAAITGAALIGWSASGVGAVLRTVWAKLQGLPDVLDYGADPTGLTDSLLAFQRCMAEHADYFVPPGIYSLSGTLSVTRQGQRIRGAGYTLNGTIIQRMGDVAFGPIISVALGATGAILENFKLQEDDTAGAYTNADPSLYLADNDHTISKVWFYAGAAQMYIEHGAGDINVTSCIFENARKSAIYGYSCGLVRITNNTFYKCTTDTTNPADRGQVIGLFKDPGYTFGCNNIIVANNWFYEAVYGHFIAMENAQAIQIVGNVFSIPSQVDSGQRDDIYMIDTADVTISGNASNANLNTYVAGQRGARYVVNIDTGCSGIHVGPNNFQPGVSGTVHDPNESIVTMLDGNSGLKVPNVASADARVLDWVEKGKTWAPVLNFGGAHAGQTYSQQDGTATRIGNLLVLQCTLAITAKGTSVGAATIAGMPYMPAGATPVAWGIECDGGVTVAGHLAMFNAGGSSEFGLYPSNNGALGAQLTDADFTTPTIRFSVVCLL